MSFSSGEQPCSKKFTMKHSLTRHKAKHHNGDPDCEGDDDSSEEDDISDAGGELIIKKLPL